MVTRSTGFSVPYAIDVQGRLVRAASAARGEPYQCPGCNSALGLRRGAVRAPHFAHSSVGHCDSARVADVTATELLRQTVRDWREGKGKRPQILRLCSWCTGAYGPQPFPDRAENCLREETVGSASTSLAVVGSTTEAAPMARIVLCDSIGEAFAVGAVQSARWFALSRTLVLADPLIWRPLRGSLNRYYCQGCSEKRAGQVEESARLAGIHRIGISREYFAVPTDCWACGKRTIVCAWHSSASWRTSRPPDPIPRFIQYRYSKTVGHKYWANTCLSCGVIQGDYFLRHEPGAPLSRLPWDAQEDNA